MLVLKRRREQIVMIGPDVTVRVLQITGDWVELGIVAPREWNIGRAVEASAGYDARSQGTEPAADCVTQLETESLMTAISEHEPAS
jgi:carbon storage regulator CsrA